MSTEKRRPVVGYSPGMVILSGSRFEKMQLRQAKGLFSEELFLPGNSLYARRLDPRKLIVLSSWDEWLGYLGQQIRDGSGVSRSDRNTLDWVVEDLACRYDGDITGRVLSEPVRRWIEGRPQPVADATTWPPPTSRDRFLERYVHAGGCTFYVNDDGSLTHIRRPQ